MNHAPQLTTAATNGPKGALVLATGSAFLPLILTEETAVLLRWQRHCHSLAVELTETFEGWVAAAHYLRKGEPRGFGGLFDLVRGPYPSRESAIRNTVAHLVHHALHMGLTPEEAIRIYRAAGVPLPPRWPNARDDRRRAPDSAQPNGA